MGRRAPRVRRTVRPSRLVSLPLTKPAYVISPSAGETSSGCVDTSAKELSAPSPSTRPHAALAITMLGSASGVVLVAKAPDSVVGMVMVNMGVRPRTIWQQLTRSTAGIFHWRALAVSKRL